MEVSPGIFGNHIVLVAKDTGDYVDININANTFKDTIKALVPETAP